MINNSYRDWTLSGVPGETCLTNIRATTEKPSSSPSPSSLLSLHHYHHHPYHGHHGRGHLGRGHGGRVTGWLRGGYGVVTSWFGDGYGVIMGWLMVMVMAYIIYGYKHI